MFNGFDQRRHADAGVGDQEIDRPELIAQRVNGGDGRGPLGNVGDGVRRLAAGGFNLLHERFESIFATREDADRALLRCQEFGQLPADAAGRAGDDGNLIGE